MHSDYKNMLLDMQYLAGGLKGKKVLDLGCDMGLEWAEKIAEEGADVLACNIVDCPRGKNPPKGVEFKILDGRNLNLPDNTFDLVYSVSVIEHVLGLEGFFREINRVLKPGGFAYLDGGANWPCHVGHHLYFTSKDGTQFFYSINNPLQPWEHLIYKEHELTKRLLTRGITSENAKEICDWIYRSEKISRVPFSVAYEEGAKSVDVLMLRYSYRKAPDEILKRLSTRYLKDDINYYGAFFIFYKPKNEAEKVEFDLLRLTLDKLPVFRYFRASQLSMGHYFLSVPVGDALHSYILKLFRENPVMKEFLVGDE